MKKYSLKSILLTEDLPASPRKVDPISKKARRTDRDASITSEPRQAAVDSQGKPIPQTMHDHQTQGQRRRRDTDANFAGDIGRLSGAPAQKKIVEFWTQLGDHFNAKSNATSAHDEDVMLQIDWSDEMTNAWRSNLAKQGDTSAFSNQSVPGFFKNMRFGIEAKQGSGQFDGANIQTDKKVFTKKINDNAAFAIGAPGGAGVIFCYIQNQKGTILKMIMDLAGQDNYSMVTADELWDIATDQNRRQDGRDRLVKEVSYENLLNLIQNVPAERKGSKAQLHWSMGITATNAITKLQTMEEELAKDYTATRRQQFADNLNAIGLSAVTASKLEQYQRSYNEYGNPLMSLGWNDAQKIGYSQLPYAFKLRRLSGSEMNDLDGYLSTIYHKDVLDFNDGAIKQKLTINIKGSVFAWLPPTEAADVDTDNSRNMRMFPSRERGPSAANIRKFNRILDRNIVVIEACIREGIFIQYEQALEDGEYVHADNWRDVFGSGQAPPPAEEPIAEIDLDPTEIPEDLSQWEDLLAVMDKEFEESSAEDALGQDTTSLDDPEALGLYDHKKYSKSKNLIKERWTKLAGLLK